MAARVILVGVGAIGSFLARLVARLASVAQLVLIDKDTYDATNFHSQDIEPGDVGHKKVTVQARRLRRLRPDLAVEAIAEPVERVPLARLRGDVILTGLDSREARRIVNQAAWRLGVPWIDAAVDPEGLLVRIATYVPSDSAPCLECGWDDSDYRALEQVYPCGGGETIPTAAPGALGALAASLEALACRALLAGGGTTASAGDQFLLDATHHRLHRARDRRSAACRFDHEIWEVSSCGEDIEVLTFDHALDLGARALRGKGPISLRVEGEVFVRRVVCVACGAARPKLLLGRRQSAPPACSRCGSEMVAGGFDQVDRLDLSALPVRQRRRSLRGVGFRPGDVFTLSRNGASAHFEIPRKRGVA